ncbi:uncharacterized protein [Kogia breviceps]|uniref:uncharacterized protein n=1 Tax=Kogia breviceps TaxID=27615 RepID=UPI0034D232D1
MRSKHRAPGLCGATLPGRGKAGAGPSVAPALGRGSLELGVCWGNLERALLPKAAPLRGPFPGWADPGSASWGAGANVSVPGSSEPLPEAIGSTWSRTAFRSRSSQSCSWITEAGALTTRLQQTRAWQNSRTPPDTPDSVRCDLGVAGERVASWSGGNVTDTSDTAQRLEHSLADQLVTSSEQISPSWKKPVFSEELKFTVQRQGNQGTETLNSPRIPQLESDTAGALSRARLIFLLTTASPALGEPH